MIDAHFIQIDVQQLREQARVNIKLHPHSLKQNVLVD